VGPVPVSRVLALVTAPRAHVAGRARAEFLRVLAALRAVDVQVDLREAGAGVGTLSASPDLDPDGDRYLEALVEDGVVPGPEGDLAAGIASADALLVLADPGRPATPPVLYLVRGERPAAATLAAIPRAGQVVIR